MERPQSDKNPKGFVAILAVSIVMAAGTMIAISIVLMSTDSFVSTNALQRSLQASLMADSCGEIAIKKLKADTNYAGNETIKIGTNTCQIKLIKGSGNTNRTIQTLSTVNSYTRKINIVIASINPITSVTSWQEVADLP